MTVPVAGSGTIIGTGGTPGAPIAAPGHSAAGNATPLAGSGLVLKSSGGGGLAEPCVDSPTGTITFRDDFIDRSPQPAWNNPTLWGDGGCGVWQSEDGVTSGGHAWQDLSVPPPWCIVYAGKPYISLANTNFAVWVTTSGNLNMTLTSQQHDNVGFGATGDQIINEALPWAATKAVFLRIRRVVGELTVRVWPQDGSHDGVEHTLAWPDEATLFPDPRLEMSIHGAPFSDGVPHGIVVAAGGGGRGLILNQPEFSPFPTLVQPDHAPPNSIEIEVGDYPFFEGDFINGWQADAIVPNHVAFFASGGSVVIANSGGSPSGSVRWGILDDVDLTSGLAAVYEINNTYAAYRLPRGGVRRVKFSGRMVTGDIGGFFFFLSYMPNSVPIPWEFAVTHYNGGGDYLAAARTVIAAGATPLGNPGDLNFDPYLGGIGVVAGGAFQVNAKYSAPYAMPAVFPTETPFNLFLASTIEPLRNCWWVEWDGPTACGSSEPLRGSGGSSVKVVSGSGVWPNRG